MNQKIFITGLLVILETIALAQESSIVRFNNSRLYAQVNKTAYQIYSTAVQIAQERSVDNQPTIALDLRDIDSTEEEIQKKVSAFENSLNNKLKEKSLNPLSIKLNRTEESYFENLFLGFSLLANNFDPFYPTPQKQTCYTFNEQNSLNIKEELLKLPYVTKVFTHKELVDYCKKFLDKENN